MKVPLCDKYLNNGKGEKRGCDVNTSRIHWWTCSPFESVKNKTESI